jgi:hypothetical protein
MFIFLLEGLQLLFLTSLTLFFQLLLLFPELLSGNNPTTAAANTIPQKLFNVYGDIIEHKSTKVGQEARKKYM